MISPGEESGPFPYRILYVDDDLKLAGLYADLLRSRGYEVRVAEGGFAALACLRKALPDLVISDLCMPGMSGMELLGIIRQRFPQLPLLAISAADMIPPDVLAADGMIRRDEQAVEELFGAVGRLLRPYHSDRTIAMPGRVPWVARPTTQELWLTCGDCLRPMRVPASALAQADVIGVYTSTCGYCGHVQPFLIGDEAA